MPNRSLAARGVSLEQAAQDQAVQVAPAPAEAQAALAAQAASATHASQVGDNESAEPIATNQGGETTGFEGQPANVNQSEQEAYNRVVMAGMKMIFENEQSQQGLIGMLKTPGAAAAEKLANASFMIITQLDEKSGGQIPEDVVLPASVEILEHMSELADSVKAFPVDPAVMNHAGQLLIVRMGEEYGVEPEDLEELMSSIDPQTMQAVGVEQESYANKQPENVGGL